MEQIQSKRITIKNELSEVQRAIAAFEGFAETHAMPLAVMAKINIVLDELLSNIVKYSFPDGKEYPIDITIELFETGRLCIQLSDPGIPFNPFSAPEPDLSLPLEDREIGGLGILIVKKLMDEFNYKRKINLNITSMAKNSI